MDKHTLVFGWRRLKESLPIWRSWPTWFTPLNNRARRDTCHGNKFLSSPTTLHVKDHYKGNTKSKLMFEFLFWLQLLAVRMKIQFCFVHVAGPRMIRQGTDDLSREKMVYQNSVGSDDAMIHHSYYVRNVWSVQGTRYGSGLCGRSIALEYHIHIDYIIFG